MSSDRVADAEKALLEARALEARELELEASLSDEERAHVVAEGISPSRYARLKGVRTLEDWTAVEDEQSALKEPGL